MYAAVCACLPASIGRLIQNCDRCLCVFVCYCARGNGITPAKISIEVIGPREQKMCSGDFTLHDIRDSEELNKIHCVCMCVWCVSVCACVSRGQPGALLSCADSNNNTVWRHIPFSCFPHMSCPHVSVAT